MSEEENKQAPPIRPITQTVQFQDIIKQYYDRYGIQHYSTNPSIDGEFIKLIAHERTITLIQAIEFTLIYLNNEKNKEK